MKAQSQAAIQFSSHPLTITEKQEWKPFSNLIVAALKPPDQTNSSEQNKPGDDPADWDINWFNNYE